MIKETVCSLLTTFCRQCAWLSCRIWYIYPGLWRKLIIRWLYFTPHLVGCNVAVIWYLELTRSETNIPEALNCPLKYHRDSSDYVFSDHCSNMVNTCWKQVKCFLGNIKLIKNLRLQSHYQQCHPVSMKEGLLLDGIFHPAGWDRPKPSWFDFSWCTWMAIDEEVN